MATTTLFVEILLIGGIAEIWLALIFFAVPSLNQVSTFSLIEQMSKLLPLLIAPLIAVTYSLGWAIVFVSDMILTKRFQVKYRDKFFEDASVRWYKVRASLFDKASEKALEDFRFGRHMIRISSSSILNFSLIALSLIPYLKKFTGVTVIGITASIVIAIVSLFQWRNTCILKHSILTRT
jgi:hypothetical protein